MHIIILMIILFVTKDGHMDSDQEYIWKVGPKVCVDNVQSITYIRQEN